MSRAGSRRGPALALGALLAATALAYAPSLSGAFVFDDQDYVLENPIVANGLTGAAVRAAFASFWVGNWHPLTWLSHALDVSVFGLAPTGHHAVNLLLHLANVALLHVVLARLTGARWRSLLAAALFAVHPLNVESVAWIAERKNLLSMLLGLGSLLAWAGFVRRGGTWRYGLSLAAFAAGLAAKPMLVVLPALLLLLDVWPLGRGPRGPVRLVVEKLPFLVLSAASCVVTVVAQRQIVMPLAIFPLWSRAANAVLSGGLYLKRAFLPFDLCAIYPHPGRAIPWFAVSASLLVLAAIGTGAWRLRRSSPAFLVGFLWFLGALVPVIGLVQVGAQGMADRYAYLPHVGVFIALAFGPGAIPPARRRAVAVLAAVALVALGVLTARQTRFWRDGLTLFSRALAVTRDNPLAHYCQAMALGAAGRAAEAVPHLRRATELMPESGPSWAALGRELLREGHRTEAAACFRRILTLENPNAELLNNAAVGLGQLSLVGEAIRAFERAIAVAPGGAMPRLNLALLLNSVGDFGGALPHFLRAIEIEPSALAEGGLGLALEKLGRFEEALSHYRRSIALDPSPRNPARAGEERLSRHR